MDEPAGRGRAQPGSGGTLFVVATPIGNLGDVTYRALEVLRAVPLIAAEDTRLTRRLLDRYSISTAIKSYHAHSSPARSGTILEHLRRGRDVALVTDAGTPGVSDPGEELIAAWAAEGGLVVPLPGPSAVVTAVAGSGIAGPRWGFEGFLPRSGRERRDRLARIAADDRATVFFEAPARLRATLVDLETACGPDRVAAVCRELTKLHEQIERGTLADLATKAGDGTIPARGEVTIVVSGATHGAGSGEAAVASAVSAEEGLAAALADVERNVASGLARGEAARKVSAATGIPRRRLYQPGAK